MKINGYGIMQIIMITLKLLNKIDLSWKMVFIPTYIITGIVVIITLIGIYQKGKMERDFNRWIKKR